MIALAFIVCTRNWGDPLELVTRSCSLWKDIPKGGILLRGSATASTFLTRRDARNAIARTETYFIGRDSSFGGFQIYRLVVAQKGGRS